MTRDVEDFVTGLVRIGTRELAAALQLPPDQLSAAMQRVADAVCQEYARSEIYVPVAYDPRNREIAQKYRQNSRSARACSPERIQELAQEFGVTSRWIYRILEAEREADFKARQACLPGLDLAA